MAQRATHPPAGPLSRARRHCRPPEASRARPGREEIAARYEREANAAGQQAAAHVRMRCEDASSAEHCPVLILGHQLRAEGNRALARMHRVLAGDAGE